MYKYVTYNCRFYLPTSFEFEVPDISSVVPPTLAPMAPGPLPFEGSNPFALEGLRQTASWQKKRSR